MTTPTAPSLDLDQEMIDTLREIGARREAARRLRGKEARGALSEIGRGRLVRVVDALSKARAKLGRIMVKAAERDAQSHSAHTPA